MTHLLYSSLILIGFYAVYWFCLRTLTFHTLNRWYLLFALVTSVLIPVMPGIPVASVVNDSFPLPTKQNEPETFLGFTVTDWLGAGSYVYGIGVSLFLLQLLAGIIRVSLRIRNATAIRWKQLHVLQIGHTTASFFHWVFLDESALSPKEREIVLTHEYEHFRRLHSLDLLFVEITRCFLWFHPVVYWVRRSLVQIHEYEVDASLAQQYGARPYAQVLPTLAVSQQGTLTHSFARHPIKNRIETLFQTPSTSMKKTLFLLALPLTVVSMALFAQDTPKPPPPPKPRAVLAPPPPTVVADPVAPPPPPPYPRKKTGKITSPPTIIADPVAPPPPPSPYPRKKTGKKTKSQPVNTKKKLSIREVTYTEFESFLKAIRTSSEKSSTEKKEMIPDDFYEKLKVYGNSRTAAITGVSWSQAERFCKWKSQQTKTTYRLPTDTELLQLSSNPALKAKMKGLWCVFFG